MSAKETTRDKESEQVVMPPAPPGESAPDAVQKTQAVAEAAAHLGRQADPERVAELVKAQTGLDFEPGEVAAILRTLAEASGPPPLDQPPPENGRRRTPQPS
jgi:hypothetical protein